MYMSEDRNNAYYPKEGFVLTHFLTVADLNRSSEFYLRIFGGSSPVVETIVSVIEDRRMS